MNSPGIKLVPQYVDIRSYGQEIPTVYGTRKFFAKIHLRHSAIQPWFSCKHPTLLHV